MSYLQLYAPAKINLGLHILNKREDGYHNIETIFQEVNLSDTIFIEIIPQDHIEIVCDDPLIPIDENNLCFQAAKLLKREMSIKKGVKITIQKNIPVGAGLGGGSSNAATVLKGLIEYWQVSISGDRLISLALRLGSDVPFFLKGGIAYAQGRGEILTSINVKLFDYFPFILLVNPGVHISTGSVYENFYPALTNIEKNVKLLDFIARLGETNSLRNLFVNEFEPYVFQQHPDLKQIKEQLYHYKALYAAMSGSGSTLYGCFNNQEDAKTALGHFTSQYWAVLTRPS